LFQKLFKNICALTPFSGLYFVSPFKCARIKFIHSEIGPNLNELFSLTLTLLFAKLCTSKEQGNSTMPKTIELPEIEFITTPEGKPKSVIISLKDWQRISETLKIMSSKELMQSIRRAKQQLRTKTKLLSLEEVLESL
jgi:PHD/YefM family antitoxin component YafN of YafNO toxin-antitoxin module